MKNPEFLKRFSNLLNLRILINCDKIDFALFLPYMKELRYLRIHFNEACDPNFLINIYNHCSKVQNFSILIHSKDDHEEFVKQIIQLMKNNILQRNCPLNLYFRCELSIQSVMRIK